MVFFDYQKMWVLAKGDSTLLLHYFKELVKKSEGYTFLVGDAFIVNEDTVLKNRDKLSDRQLAEYLGICALRPYAPYKYRGITDLPLELFPAYIPKIVVEGIPILKVQGNKLHFPKEI